MDEGREVGIGMTITGKRHETVEAFLAEGAVGDWAFTEDNAYICIETPGGTAILPIDPVVSAQHNKPHWTWDGNRDAPTLTPSILHHGTPEWHGWMREGKLETS